MSILLKKKWLHMHIYTNIKPLHALPLCYSSLNFWKKKDKKCKAVHQPHYEIWWKKSKNMIVKLLLLENYRIQSLCSPFLHSLFPSFKRFLESSMGKPFRFSIIHLSMLHIARMGYFHKTFSYGKRKKSQDVRPAK